MRKIPPSAARPSIHPNPQLPRRPGESLSGMPSLPGLPLVLASLFAAGCGPEEPAAPVHNVILFVADGLRPGVINGADTPALYAVRTEGSFFENSHSHFPTLTMTNAASLATGAFVGQTGIFGNYIYAGFKVGSAAGNPAPFLENDLVLSEVARHHDGHLMGMPTLLERARLAGMSTASIGKLGPTLLQDVLANDGQSTVIMDDSTGSASGVPLSAEMQQRLQQAGLPVMPPPRGDNGKRGDFQTPGTLVPNQVQQEYFAAVTTRVLLPLFKERGAPFFLVYWSRDPDGTQHNQGDSLGSLSPGINGPTSLLAVKNADQNLASLRTALRELGLEDTTDVLVTSDHGFSTISKQSTTSFAANRMYPDVPRGQLPAGFLAIDLGQALQLPLYDGEQLMPNPTGIDPMSGQHPKTGDGILGTDPANPEVIVAVNGNLDLVYFPGSQAKVLLPKAIEFLLEQDYVSGLWVNEELGSFPGTLKLGDIGLSGSARTPRPALVVGFASGDTGCADKTLCAFAVTDWNLQQGQGFHGSFGRADTLNNMAAVGPDFRSGYIDRAPVSNADLGATLAALLRLPAVPMDPGGRLLTEALNGPLGGPEPPSLRGTLESAPGGTQGHKTLIRYQEAAGRRYFDAGGFAGRTNGL